jgi:hypothetical protein
METRLFDESEDAEFLNECVESFDNGKWHLSKQVADISNIRISLSIVKTNLCGCLIDETTVKDYNLIIR